MRRYSAGICWCMAVAWLAISGQAAAQYSETHTRCIQCHERGLKQNDFCAEVSEDVWAQDDKHRRAFWLLHESDPADPQKGAAKRALVRQILGFELAEAFTDGQYVRLKSDADAETARKVAVVKSCLRCHGTWPIDADAEHAHEPPVPLELGVSCQACHGPGEKWDAPHALKAWRAVTPEAKAALGFFDCRSPAAKTKLCASCHVGSVTEGKFVKHEWYAAGHPPLPGFELANFQLQMPRHWKSLREKGDFAYRADPPRDDAGQIRRQVESLKRSGVPAEAIKRSYLEANFPEAMASGVDPSGDFAAARDAVVGGAVVLEMYARLIGDYAEQAASGKAPWPELALYDCGACHHELRGGMSSSSRPQRRHAPGRPPLAGWTLALARLPAFQAGGYDEAAAGERWSAIESKLVELERAMTGRPFGDAGAMQMAARDVVQAAVDMQNDVVLSRFDRTAAEGAVHVLLGASDYEVHDFACARQAAWAIQTISLELGHSDAHELFETRAGDRLGLVLPAGPGGSVMENLHRWLPAAAKYDPVWFRQELSEIRERLSK